MTKTYKLFNVVLITSFLLLGNYSLNAQQNKELINSQLQTEQVRNNWLSSDIADYLISDQYTDAETGLTHAYIQQRHHNIIVFNAISVFLIKNNKVLYFKPGLVDHLAQKIKTDKPAIEPEAAIGYALIYLGRTDIAPVKLISQDESLNTYTFESPGISSSPVKVQLVYRAMEDGIFLSWDVSIEMKNEPHWWNIRVNALTGDYIDKNDFTANCSFDAPSDEYLAHYYADATAAPFLPPLPVAVYNIFPFPLEAPTFGSRSVVTNPADPTASPYGWHDVDGIAGNDFTKTRGNNVYAYEDANNDNQPGFSPDTANLQFDYPYNSAAAPLVNQNTAITNLFYANNRVHDVLYHEGFNEASGNFQQNNYGNGGNANDYVKAEAFDGSGSNNANFSTPPDGLSGRMQMYLWSGSPQKDGSFDNGVITHEYGHGLSNRLTGGPSQAGCLGNAEQGGEGWSDWLALMMTIEPSDTGAGFLGQARGIGTYVLGQAPTGAGIRRFRYSTNMSINPQTYADVALNTEVHRIGEIWCDAIWDMSSFLINDLGFNSDPAVGAAGNNIAMRLVVEGMKLQPCNPGFLDARDAILNADAILYNNVHRCRIWEAFARRGMGYNAVQGSANSASDQVAGFTMPYFCSPAVSPPVAAFTSDVSSIPCAGTVHFTDASVQSYNWNWNFGDQTTSILQNPSHTYNSPGTYTVKLVVTNPLGSDSVTHTITVTSTYTATVTATPTAVTCGSPVQLNAVASGSSNLTYSVTGIPYAPLSGTPINVSLNDDQMSSVKPIGFTFNFFGQSYTNFYICSNGFITFSSGQSANVVYGVPIPSTATPNNFIALAWNDLYPQGIAAAVSYFNTGVSPNQKLVVTYNTHHFGGVAYPFVVQAILSEGSNEIEIHTTTISDASPFDDAATTTQGVENAGGTGGVAVPGRNGTIFTASNDAYKFTPLIAYTYNWQPGNLTGPSQTVNPIATGTYTVNVADGSGCIAPFSTPLITVNPITAVITGNTSFCAGSSTILDAGAHASYQWSTGETTQTISVNTPGAFTVTVTNANGCSASASVTSLVNPLPSCLITGNSSICEGASSQWCATPGMASYLWSSGATTQCITVITSGVYTVTVTDADGCTNNCNQTLVVNPNPSPFISGPTSFCSGGSTALNAGSYTTYLWSTSATTQTISVNTAGTFTVTVTDANGCPGTAQVTTIVNPLPTPSISGITSLCAGSSGTLNAGAGYSAYLWSTSETTETISVNAAGTFTVTVTDANGCSGSASKAIAVVSITSKIVINTPISCNGGCDGILSVSSTPAPYTMIWSNGKSTKIISGECQGTYTVTVNNGTGCTKVITKKFNDPPALLTNCTKTEITSHNANNGSVTWNTHGGTAPYSYLWNDGVTTGNRTNIAPGSYTITITDAHGCTLVIHKKWKNPPARISEATANEHVSVYPNPSDGIFTVLINAENAATYTMKITDLQGRIVWSDRYEVIVGAQEYNIDMTGVAKGIYILSLSNMEHTTIKKLVMQ